jgi:peptidoglycan/xylan/chitin deacetylase (PgdA/CDA1 family)
MSSAVNHPSDLTVVMYHYVRELPFTRFPAIKGLLESEFCYQLDHFAENYSFVTVDQCLDAMNGIRPLPQRAIMLTFDDGFSDHYDTVFPILALRGIQGVFFPPAQAILEHKILDVHKIHFILAALEDKQRLVYALLSALDDARRSGVYAVKSNEEYYSSLAVPNRFDPAEVVFFKRMLQRELPPALRSQIAAHLFSDNVYGDETVFARELYMSMDQLRLMMRSGMAVGSHGWSHVWLDAIDELEMKQEIARSLQFLGALSIDPWNWLLSYPYGAYNAAVIRELEGSGCAMAFTTKVATAKLYGKPAMELPRYDTNDFPKCRAAAA